MTDLDRGASAGDVTEARYTSYSDTGSSAAGGFVPQHEGGVLYSARAIISFWASPPEVMTTRLAPPPAGIVIADGDVHLFRILAAM